MKVLNANWTAGADGQDGQFECLIITDDDERHVVTATAPDMIALVALARADTVLLWDLPVHTLIVANIVGRMPWTERARPSPLAEAEASQMAEVFATLADPGRIRGDKRGKWTGWSIVPAWIDSVRAALGFIAGRPSPGRGRR